MSSAIVSDFSSVSALFNIEIASINGKAPTGQELVEAVKTDVLRTLPVSKTAFFKYFSGNRSLSDAQLEEVIEVLKAGMMQHIEKTPDASLSYAHAVIVCSSELASRGL